MSTTCGKCGTVLNEYNSYRAYQKTGSLRCKNCHNAYMKAWRKANPERTRGYSHEWYETNGEQQRENRREQYKIKRAIELEQTRLWRAANQDKVRQMHLKYEYGISVEEFELKWKHQNGKCAICLSPLEERHNYAVDHDHVTDRFRGLLCTACNLFLGRYEKMKQLGLLPTIESYLNNGFGE